MAKAKVDPVAWAKSTARRVGGQKCSVCSVPGAVAAIKAWVPLWKSGAITITASQARDWLAENTDWSGTTGTLRGCLVRHHGFSARG